MRMVVTICIVVGALAVVLGGAWGESCPAPPGNQTGGTPAGSGTAVTYCCDRDTGDPACYPGNLVLPAKYDYCWWAKWTKYNRPDGTYYYRCTSARDTGCCNGETAPPQPCGKGAYDAYTSDEECS